MLTNVQVVVDPTFLVNMEFPFLLVAKRASDLMERLALKIARVSTFV